jgi:S-adenosylmethionine hydrolase
VTPVVTLLSDFGATDEFAGVMEAVIAGVAPQARVIHLTHGISPHAVLPGALALARALPFAPVGVHVAVVDPGVGTERRAIALRTGDGRILIGPDNGVLIPAADACGGVAEAFAITNPELFCHPVSRTFHGRDVFAPVAGHLAAGLALTAVGPALDAAGLTRLAIPVPALDTGSVRAQVLGIDRFGNVALNVRGEELDLHGLDSGTRVEIRAGDGRYFAVRAQTFADVRPGEMVVYDDSSGWASLAVNSGSLADVCDLEPGDSVLLERA